MSVTHDETIIGELRTTRRGIGQRLSMMVTLEEVDALLRAVDERDELRRQTVGDWEPDFPPVRVDTFTPSLPHGQTVRASSCPRRGTSHDCPLGGCADDSPRETSIPDLPREERETPPPPPCPRCGHVLHALNPGPCMVIIADSPGGALYCACGRVEPVTGRGA